MPRTRSKKAGAGKREEVETTTTTTTVPTLELERSVANPPQLFILPRHISPESRIVTLPNPAASTPNRYLVCAEKGCYEFTRVAPAHKKECKSWLLAPHRTASAHGATAKDDAEEEGDRDKGYVLQSPDLMIATPIDPLFLILPTLIEDAEEGKGVQMYLSSSDYIARLEEDSEHFRHMMQGPGRSNLERMFEQRLLSICDSMRAGDETLYRLSRTKLWNVLMEKAKKMARKGLPASIEERFVRQALAVPVLSIRREESSVSAACEALEASGGAEEKYSASSVEESQDTQASGTTVTSAASTAATSISSFPATAGNEPTASSEEEASIAHLLRIRTALNFLLTSYIPPTLRTDLERALLSSTSTVDFSPLTTHLAHIDKLKREAQALRSLSDNISRKRNAAHEDDEEAMAKVEAKKRKKEEEDLKKKNTSRAVQALKKADRSGMKTLSSFFTKKAAPAKK